MASGMAGKIRRAAESDEFDLANYDQARCDDLVKAAFMEPLPLGHMIKLSFIVGGGKLVRQRYNDDLPKVFMISLGLVGYADDTSASLESPGGQYKFQHDTGKNLKFVHVFPRITGVSELEGKDGDDEAEDKPITQEQFLFQCERDVFNRVLFDRLQTYSQKKCLLDLLKARISDLEVIEAKLANLEPLSLEEQDMFDDVGVVELRDKAKTITALMQGMVEDGKLTATEKSKLMEKLDEKTKTMTEEIKKAESEEKPKRAQTLTQQLEMVQNTRRAVKEMHPVELPPLKYSNELLRLHSRLEALERELKRIEKGSSGGKYTLEELKKFSEKTDLQEAIEAYETKSRGWLEEDVVFLERKQACQKAAASQKRTVQRPSASGSAWQVPLRRR